MLWWEVSGISGLEQCLSCRFVRTMMDKAVLYSWVLESTQLTEFGLTKLWLCLKSASGEPVGLGIMAQALNLSLHHPASNGTLGTFSA